MTKFSPRLWATSAIALVVAATGAPTTAQEADDDGRLEEIVVTAQRRNESLQDVPIAVSAFTDKEMMARQITETLDIVNYVPNMIGHNNVGIGTGNTYYIRGLGNTESIATFDPPVGSYIDDVYMARQNANNFAFFDVERIEVLRGPQGTLFGRNTTGGAINVIMKKPGEEFSGFAEAGYGRFDRFELRGSFDIPFSDMIQTKISAYYLKDDGFATNQTTGEINNDEKNFGIRAALRVKLSESILWDVAISYVDEDHANALNSVGPNGNRITFTGLTETGTPLAGVVTGAKQNFALGNRTQTLSITSNLELDTGLGTVNFITGYRNLDHEFNLDFFDVFGGPFNTGVFVIVNDGSHKQFTQEVKLNGSLGDKLDYVAGIFYINEDNTTDFADIFTIDIGLGPIGFPLILADRTLENTAEAIALYAQVDYSITEQLTATAGLRYTDETKKIGYTANGNPAALASFDTADIAAAGIPLKLGTSILTPRFAVEYAVNDDAMIFVSATRGFKSGGWNARGTAADLIQAFSPEKIWSYEAGIRTEWMDNRLRLNVTGFYSDVSDYQIPSGFNSGGGITFITKNFADLKVTGLELEASASLTEAFNVYVTLGLQDAEYRNQDPIIVAQQADCKAGVDVANTCANGIVNERGDLSSPVRTPDVTLNIGANYTLNVSGFEIVPNFNTRYVDTYNFDISGRDIAQQESYWLVNAGITVGPESGRWSASAECDNCFGKVYQVSFLAGTIYIDDPSTWLLRLRYNFN